MNDTPDHHSSIRDRRVQYETAGLDIADVTSDPIEQWHRWHADALDAGVAEPNAMTVSTVDLHGVPDARILLARGVDRFGFVFYTNYESAKSRQINAKPVAAATFAWLDLHRQVRIRGTVERVSDELSDSYFATRPHESQIGAWASPQSEVIADRAELDRLVEAQRIAFGNADPVPRPAHWGGWRLVPDEFEFWQGRPSRLHDRIHYRLVDDHWHVSRLAP
ncbi:pyridoxamine 5'-phosphate oxidase [Ilumatobacter sp.]|uniref:pyridoxamine 5'-phosphate oxidase n=1 Tax=Ilumatobacter sp. TaxID=1967498 RepID=UPI003AF4170E